MRRVLAASLAMAAATGCGEHRSSRPPGHFAIGLAEVRLTAADGSTSRSLALRPETDGLLKPELSRDGKTIVYAAPKGVYVAAASGGRVRFVRVDLSAGDLSFSEPALSPDGKRVALTTDSAVYVVSLRDGSIEHTLVEADGPAEVDWAADADRIVYLTGTVDPNQVAGPIVVSRSDGTGRHQVAVGSDPSVSPDGKRVAFTRWIRRRGLVRAGVFVVDVAGGRPRRIVAGAASRPAWSPDGRWLAYMWVVGCGHVCTERLRVVPAGGGRPRNVTPPLQFDGPQYTWGG